MCSYWKGAKIKPNVLKNKVLLYCKSVTVCIDQNDVVVSLTFLTSNTMTNHRILISEGYYTQNHSVQP